MEGRADGLEAGEDAPDPLPEVPTFLLNLEQMETLTREVGRKAADVPEPDEELCNESIDLEELSGLEQLEELVSKADSPREDASEKKRPWSPKVRSRDVVATCQNSDAFGEQLAARAWHLGLFQAKFKAFVGDGGSWLWTIWERHFKPFDFVPILDIIHAVTHLYAAAMAGRCGPGSDPTAFAPPSRLEETNAKSSPSNSPSRPLKARAARQRRSPNSSPEGKKSRRDFLRRVWGCSHATSPAGVSNAESLV